MANPKRRHQRRGSSRPRRRSRRNPKLNSQLNARTNRHGSYRRRRRSRNPLSLGGVQRLARSAVFAIVGGIGTRSIPASVLGDRNVGAAGYASNVLAAAGLAALAGQFFKDEDRDAVLLGGVVMIAGRAVEEYVGQRLVEFAQYQLPIPGLSGDDRYNLRLAGEFRNVNFPLPTSSLPGAQCALPAPVAAGVPMGEVWREPWGG